LLVYAVHLPVRARLKLNENKMLLMFTFVKARCACQWEGKEKLAKVKAVAFYARYGLIMPLAQGKM